MAMAFETEIITVGLGMEGRPEDKDSIYLCYAHSPTVSTRTADSALRL